MVAWLGKHQKDPSKSIAAGLGGTAEDMARTCADVMDVYAGRKTQAQTRLEAVAPELMGYVATCGARSLGELRAQLSRASWRGEALEAAVAYARSIGMPA